MVTDAAFDLLAPPAAATPRARCAASSLDLDTETA
jgi:hypothetical protein